MYFNSNVTEHMYQLWTIRQWQTEIDDNTSLGPLKF